MKNKKLEYKIFYLVRGVSIHSYLSEGIQVPGLNDEIKTENIRAIKCILPDTYSTLGEKNIKTWAKEEQEFIRNTGFLPVLLYTEKKHSFYLTHSLCLFNIHTFTFEEMGKGEQLSILLRIPHLIR